MRQLIGVVLLGGAVAILLSPLETGQAPAESAAAAEWHLSNVRKLTSGENAG
jgi:hypothetical protein